MGKRDRREHIDDALLSWVEIDDLPIQVRTEFFPRTPERCVVGVEVGLMRGLLAVDDAGARVELLLYLREDGGRDIARYREEVPLTAAASLQDLRYVKTIDAKPGKYWLKVVARDNVKGTVGTSVAHLTIPEFDDDRPIISTLMLMAPDDRANLVAAREGGSFAERAFHVDDRHFFPVPDNVFPAKGEVVCFFRVGNLKLDRETSRPRMTVRYTIWRGDQPVSQQTVHYSAAEAPSPDEGLPIYVRVPVEGLGEGDYRLEVSAYDILATKGIKSEVKFTVAPG